MSIREQQLSGTRSRSHSAPNRATGMMAILLYLYLVVFPASYIFHSGMATALALVKPFVLLTLALYMIYALFVGLVPPTKGIAKYLFSALIVSMTLSSALTDYHDSDFLLVVGMAFLLAAALLLAGFVKSQHLEEDLFATVLNVGRIIITLSFVMAVLNINLGRAPSRFSGWTDNPNSLALIIAPYIIILLAGILQRPKHWTFNLLPFFAAAIFVLMLTGSRASIGWALISMTVFVAAKLGPNLRLAAIIIAVLLCVGFGSELSELAVQFASRNNPNLDASTYDNLLSGRTEAWQVGFDSISRNPVFGIGAGNEELLLADHVSEFLLHQGADMHSSFISAVVSYGYIGFALLLSIISVALWNGWSEVMRSHAFSKCNYQQSILPFSLLVGACFHALSETWLLNPGNANSLLTWVLIAYYLIPNRRRQSRYSGSMLHR